MKLSETAWNMSLPVVEAIKKHPFNRELAQGTLAMDKFAYYIEQDIIYLQCFSRCLALIASKAPFDYVRCFLRYADYTSLGEQEVVHHYFKETFHFKKTNLITPATLSYTSYLLAICMSEPVEIAIASILPCFWVYREVGLSIIESATPTNPFSKWISTYAGESFSNTVNEAINIFDAVASNTSDKIRSSMLDAFYKSTVLEWHFWNDSYNKTVFDNILSA